MDAIAITFDVDWAPDWTIEVCWKICRQYGKKSTFFVTHKSDIIDSLKLDGTIELGVHPNFLDNSTHGNNNKDIIQYCLEIVPDATSMRTHCLVQSSPIIAMVSSMYSQIITDVSLLLPLHQNLMPTDLYPGCGQRITRLPYFWEDDLLATWPGWDWASAKVPDHPGLRIYDFHPIHVALNSSDLSEYTALREYAGTKPLYELTKADLAPFVNKDAGARTYLERVLEYGGNFTTITEITKAHRAQ